ncbi:hypothetical protein ACWT_4524 [Actinoplanes sp. SE50]|nr:hypothetical protein ACPL_4655 [Actinoplanes sp. SE50/110]ATO83939.1 hypothetical protein ACWT_4524 [Actinoplanes sp. SE50]SLM01349.1 hypothetical protein ACSP50_4585 [Actinoplanes sp. SE50/110]
MPRALLTYGGPAVVVGLVAAAVGSALLVRDDRDRHPAECGPDPATVQAIGGESILRHHPEASHLNELSPDGYQCGDSPMAAVSRSLIGPLSRSEVVRYYGRLAEASGWRRFDGSRQIYSASKTTAGGCPWWFVISPGQNEYHLQVFYLPAGIPQDRCVWKSQEPLLLGLPPK